MSVASARLLICRDGVLGPHARARALFREWTHLMHLFLSTLESSAMSAIRPMRYMWSAMLSGCLMPLRTHPVRLVVFRLCRMRKKLTTLRGERMREGVRARDVGDGRRDRRASAAHADGRVGGSARSVRDPRIAHLFGSKAMAACARSIDRGGCLGAELGWGREGL